MLSVSGLYYKLVQVDHLFEFHRGNVISYLSSPINATEYLVVNFDQLRVLKNICSCHDHQLVYSVYANYLVRRKQSRLKNISLYNANF